MSLLEVNDFSVSYKPKKKIVHNVSLTVENSDILGVVGESGSGKTTLTKGILSQLRFTEGEVKIDGKSTKSLSRKELSKNIQMIFQNPAGSFNAQYKIEVSLREVAKIHKIDREDYEKRLSSLLEKTALAPELLERYPSQLSGGQLQRFAICRALLIQPKLLIADEAVSALDVSIRGDILKLLLKLHKELGIGIIFISHDLNVVHRICNKVVVLYHGEIVEAGDTKKVYQNPQHEYTKILLNSKTKTHPDEVKS